MSGHQTSIRRQLLKAIMLTSGLVLALASAALVFYELISLHQSMAEHLTSLANAIADNCAGPLAFENRPEAEQVLASLQKEPHFQAAALYDKGGSLFASFRKGTAAIPLAPGPVGHRFGSGRLEVFRPVERAGNRLGMLYLRSDLGAIEQRMRVYGLIALGVIGTSLLAGYLLSDRLQRAISTPVLTLARAAKTITERNDYSVRAERLSGGELGLLTEAFNQMLDEIQRRQAELADANRELEAFGYSVSHDLRAPLRHISSYVRLLQKDAAGPSLNARSLEDLQILGDAAMRMGSLIDDLLSLSRLGRATMIEQQVSLKRLVEEARQELAPATAGRAIEWVISPLPEVHGDPNLLRNVLVNLLSNAVKYTRPRNPARIEIGSQRRGNELVCFVRDNGVGFEMEFVDKLFGVFQRLHAAEDFEGTGIGLASVRRIIQRHGGRTWAEGQVDHGATFYFSLPKERLHEDIKTHSARRR
jgi:signal transduction histidine kinase